jgi:hypothetical protein
MKSFTLISLALAGALPSIAQTTNEVPPAFTIPPPALESVPLLATSTAASYIPSYVLPNPFPSAAVTPRVTLHDKFQRYYSDTYDPRQQMDFFLTSAFGLAVGGADDWGTGPGAYMNRFSSQVGLRAVRNTIRFGFDAALGTDSHYRRSESNGFLPRLGHAMLSTVTTYKDGGGRTIGIPQIAGAYGGAFISNAWYPHTRNSTGDALLRGTSSLGFTAAKNVFREFWPEIKKLLPGR